MVAKSSFFWEDARQAQERLSGSFVLYGDNPVLIEEVSSGAIPTANTIVYPTKERKVISLDDPKFHRFRVLPPVGWFNHSQQKSAFFADRRPVRRTLHGLSDNNVFVGYLRTGQSILKFNDFRYSRLAADVGYYEACREEFPALADALTHVRAETTLAVSPRLAVYRDADGLRWLYHNADRVGLFSGTDSLLLLSKYSFLKEELNESPAFTIENIKEF